MTADRWGQKKRTTKKGKKILCLYSMLLMHATMMRLEMVLDFHVYQTRGNKDMSAVIFKVLVKSLPIVLLIKEGLTVVIIEERCEGIYHSISQYSTSQYSTVHHSTVQYITVQYITVQYSTSQYCTVQYIAVQYRVKNTCTCVGLPSLAPFL